MEPTVTDLAAKLTETQTAVNIMWTMLAGFLVMFMQAGFALVETGLTRAKNVAHTMGMNFFVYAIGIIGYYFVGFGLQMGGVGAMAPFGNDATLSAAPLTFTLLGKTFGLFGDERLHAAALDVHAPRSRPCSSSRWCSWTPPARSRPARMAERWKFTLVRPLLVRDLRRSSTRSTGRGSGAAAGSPSSA